MQPRILRRAEVRNYTGLPYSTLYRLIAEKKFPAPIKLGERAVGWELASIDKWLESRKAISH